MSFLDTQSVHEDYVTCVFSVLYSLTVCCLTWFILNTHIKIQLLDNGGKRRT